MLRYEGFEPRAGGVRALLPHVDAFLPVHNLASLEELTTQLTAVPTRRAATAGETTVELTGERTLPVSRETRVACAERHESLKSAVPGCESFVASGENAFDVAVNAAIGPVKARFKGKLELADVQAPESYAIRFDMQGGAAGFSRGDARVKLEAVDANTTRMTYVVNASIGGKIAQIGSRLVDAAVRDDGRPVLHDLCGGSRGEVSAGGRRARTCAVAKAPGFFATLWAFLKRLFGGR